MFTISALGILKKSCMYYTHSQVHVNKQINKLYIPINIFNIYIYAYARSICFLLGKNILFKGLTWCQYYIKNRVMKYKYIR